jgi:hypothetical protein
MRPASQVREPLVLKPKIIKRDDGIGDGMYTKSIAADPGRSVGVRDVD